MKFPAKKSSKNLNNKGGSAPIQKDQKKQQSKLSNGFNSSSFTNKNTKQSFLNPSHKKNKNNSYIQE